MAATRAQKNRAVRQEALREQLSSQKLLEHVLDLSRKMADPVQDIPSEMVTRYKIAIDTNLKLVNKYLPDLKATEITGEGGEPVSVQLVNYADSDNTE